MSARISLPARLALGLAAAVVAALPAAAADGVVEIDAACVAVGCFPNDGPGFPVEIFGPGSYKLTSNLDTRPTGFDVDAIRIQGPAVTLDLAGFSLFGPSVCSGQPLACSPSSVTAAGIRVLDEGAAIRNGAAIGFAYGVYASGAHTRIQDLTIWSNSASGIFAAGAGNQVVGVTLFRNGRDGIVLGGAGMVRRSTIYGNGMRGVFSFGDNLLVDNTIYGNAARGVEGGGSSLYARNVISGNASDGLHDGFGGSLAFGNTLANNTSIALFFEGGTKSGYTENVMSSNGSSVSGGLSLTQNVCNGASC